jgi:hypothetical protein
VRKKIKTAMQGANLLGYMREYNVWDKYSMFSAKKTAQMVW